MATANHSTDTLAKLSYYFDHCSHADWDRFSAAEQERMVDDDLFAGRSVALVLTSLIAIGMALSAITLAYVAFVT